MMRTPGQTVVLGMFRDRLAAQDALAALRDAGFAADSVGVATPKYMLPMTIAKIRNGGTRKRDRTMRSRNSMGCFEPGDVRRPRFVATI